MGLISRVSSRTYRKMLNIRLLFRNPGQWATLTRQNWSRMGFYDKAHTITVGGLIGWSCHLSYHFYLGFQHRYAEYSANVAVFEAEQAEFEKQKKLAEEAGLETGPEAEPTVLTLEDTFQKNMTMKKHSNEKL